jgi:hypothetical protein
MLHYQKYNNCRLKANNSLTIGLATGPVDIVRMEVHPDDLTPISSMHVVVDGTTIASVSRSRFDELPNGTESGRVVLFSDVKCGDRPADLVLRYLDGMVHYEEKHTYVNTPGLYIYT